MTHHFIETLRASTLEGSGMQQDNIDSLWIPGPVNNLEDPFPLLRSLWHFINNGSVSMAHYNTTQKIELLNNPTDEFLSFNKIKCCIRWLSGVVTLEHNMCTNLCITYTGPDVDLEACPCCGTSRYLPGTTDPCKHFATIPIGPGIQAFYGTADIAENMHYLEK